MPTVETYRGVKYDECQDVLRPEVAERIDNLASRQWVYMHLGSLQQLLPAQKLFPHQHPLQVQPAGRPLTAG